MVTTIDSLIIRVACSRCLINYTVNDLTLAFDPDVVCGQGWVCVHPLRLQTCRERVSWLTPICLLVARCEATVSHECVGFRVRQRVKIASDDKQILA